MLHDIPAGTTEWYREYRRLQAAAQMPELREPSVAASEDGEGSERPERDERRPLVEMPEGTFDPD